MPRKIVLLSGPVSSGKSTLADALGLEFGAHRFSTREILAKQELAKQRGGRSALQRRGAHLDARTSGRWVVDALQRPIGELDENALVVVDSVRVAGQIEAFRAAFGRTVVHVHLTAPYDVLVQRYKNKQRRGRSDELASYGAVQRDPTEKQVQTLADEADIVIDTRRCTKEDVAFRAASHLRLTARETARAVDVLVGGQYGSEGKGNIVSHLAPEYDLLVRVGGPNAGHKVYAQTGVMTHHMLPSGTMTAPTARLLIGPGAVLNSDKLLEEIAHCDVDVERLKIDPQAMIITPRDIRREQKLVESIGSTGQGVGVATARRITDRYRGVKLAKDVPALRPYMKPASEVLQAAYARGERVLLEGTQGTGLSLYHGFYPHVTSRDTTAAGTLAEAGIAPTRVRRIVIVCRTYPIRVGDPKAGTSGPMSQPLSWGEIGRRSGYDPRVLRKAEKTSTTGRKRRVAEFDWDLLRRSVLLNGPTDVALTFVDYIRKENEHARRFEQLSPDTIQFIEEVERVARAPVSLISTRFHPRSIIDRRRW